MIVSTKPEEGAQDLTAPVELMEVEVTDRLPAVPDSPTGDGRGVWVLVRMAGEPLAQVELVVGPGGASAAALGRSIWDRCGSQINARLVAAGHPVAADLPDEGLGIDPATTRYRQVRARALARAPLFSVVICTRDRREQLARCLDRLAGLRYPDFEVVVVDNAPRGQGTRSVVDGAAVPCRYVRENRPGLAWARNAGAAAAAGDFLAFMDDDEAPDPDWLSELMVGFRSGENVGCVAGMILPAALGTQAQLWFEQFGGHSKGRGFAPAVFSARGSQSPVYPLPPFGAGGNMAFRRDALSTIGGFDVALGAGTPACGAEDTFAFSRLLLSGYRMAYQPSALVRHEHYADAAGLNRQFHGYGVGLTAYYTALLRRQPRLVTDLVALVPAAVRDLRGNDSARTSLPDDFPASVRRGELMGMVRGPLAYVRSRREQMRRGTAWPG